MNTCAADSCVIADAYPSQFASQYHISLAPGDDTVTIDLSAEYLGACTLGTASPGTPFACNLYVLAAFDNAGCPTSTTMCVSRPVKVSPGASLCAWSCLGPHCLVLTCLRVPVRQALFSTACVSSVWLVVAARVPPSLLPCSDYRSFVMCHEQHRRRAGHVRLSSRPDMRGAAGRSCP